jgi:hypothetical protein
MTDPVEEAAKLPLSQKLEHSHWKVRATAYEELAKKFTEAEDSNAGFFNEFGMWFHAGRFLTFLAVGEIRIDCFLSNPMKLKISRKLFWIRTPSLWRRD